MSDVPTPEEITKVRRWECSERGHDFETVVEVGVLDPQSITCTHCGMSWSVSPETADSFEADTLLLQYFGSIYRAACEAVASAPGAERVVALQDLEHSLALPPDIEAAVEGPRGRGSNG